MEDFKKLDSFDKYFVNNKRADSTLTWTPSVAGGGTAYNSMWAKIFNAPMDFGANVNKVTAPYVQHGYFFAAVSVKGDALAPVPFRYYEGDWKSTKAAISQNYERYEKLFDIPNERTTGPQFWKTHSVHRDVFGEALWVFLDDRGEPTTIDKARELWHLSPDQWGARIDPKSDRIIEWEQLNTNPKRTIRAEFVYQFQEPNPYNPYRGLSRALVAGLSIDTDFLSKQANKNFVTNGFNLGGILTGEDWDKTAAQDVSDAISKNHAGPDKQGRMLVLGGTKLTFYPNATNHKGMQYIEGLEFNRDEIFSIVGVPNSWVSRGSSSNYSTATAEDVGTWQRTMMPMMEEVKNVLWARHFSQLGGKTAKWLAFDYNSIAPLREALLTSKLETAKKYIDLGYPINIVNAALELGMPKLAWGDEAYANGAMRPISLLMNAGDVPTEEQFAATNEAAINSPTSAPVKASGQNVNSGGTTREDTSSADRRAQYWRAFDTKIGTPMERSFKKKIIAYFNAMRNEVVSSVKKLAERSAREFTDAEIESILFDLAQWNEKLLKQTRPLYERLSTEITADLEKELGGLSAWKDGNPVISKIIDLRGAELVKVNDTLRGELRDLLVSASKDNLTIADTASLVSDLFDAGGQDGRGRALRIARTETASAANSFRNEAFKAEGVERQEWASSRDAAVRDSHAQLDGEVRAVGENFSNGLAYPGDPSGAPEEVINCRCLTIPLPTENTTDETQA